MAFVNVSLLLGTALIGIPILLHLVMRQKPRKLVFPAVRFLQRRADSNRRTLRLRHWLLLLLRCLALAAAAAALARPSVSSRAFGDWLVIAVLALLLVLVGVLFLAGYLTRQGKLLLLALAAMGGALLVALVLMLPATWSATDASRLGDRAAPVAAVMVLDSSPRMLYRHENLTRIEQAQEIADWMIRQLPAESRVAVLDSRAITPVFSIDLGSARKTLQRVQSTGAPRPLPQLLNTALDLLAQSDLKRKEIYVYTDLAANAWQVSDTTQLRRRLDEAPEVALYLVDVGMESPRNFRLGDVTLSDQALTENAGLTVRTTVSCIGAGGTRQLELYLEDVDPALPLMRDGEVVLPPARLQSRQEITLAEGGSQEVEFVLSGLALGTRHATLRFSQPDALPVDDARYATVRVRPPWLVLVVAPEAVNTSAFVEAIAPYAHRLDQRANYDCLVITPEEMVHHALVDFAAVILLDPPPLSTNLWQQLGSYVGEGGQLALFLGAEAGDGRAFNTPEAMELMPGRLTRPYRVAGRDVYLAPHSYDHPVLRKFRPIATSVPWDQFPVFRYWNVRDVVPEAQVVLRYGNNKPALFERPVGQGTVMVMTTPITEPERPVGRPAWNELAGFNDWPRFLLVNELMRYLTQHDAGQYNYQTGQSVVLANPEDEAPTRYQLFTPKGDTLPVQARDGRLTVGTTDAPGIYRLKGELQGPVTRGFSVNLPERATLLQRTTREHFDAIFGEDRYQLARDRVEIEREQGNQRSGREFFPLLMVVLSITLILEHLLANRFYRDTHTSTS